MADFVHLHCHTEYSLLDGAIRISDLVKRAQAFGCPAAAITDHGNMHGGLVFYEACKKAGLKPIIGCEVYVAKGERSSRDARSPRDAGYHLILLAQNDVGFRNLLKLSSEGYLSGFHYKPRVDKALLAAHSEGLIALSACLKGEIHQKLLKEGMDEGRKTLAEYRALFPDRLYLEIQANDLAEQAQLNALVTELAHEEGLPLVATNDCHYLEAGDADAHDVLLCIQTQSQVDDVKRMRFTTRELYYRSPEEMAAAFPGQSQALANSCEIASRCNLELDLKTYHFPVYEVAPGRSLDDEMAAMAREGLTKRLEAMSLEPGQEKRYWDRLEYELGVITKMGFPGYFLIVQDFINWAKSQGIPVGPGRGSAAGSLVAYALRITNLDPLPYDLLFERFLNIERISMPDIDVDFCERRRTEVIRYVSEKYGRDSVAQITTFGTMKAKAVVRDVGRALGMSFGETDRIAKLIPEDLKMTIDKALTLEPELPAMAAQDARVARLIDVSRRLEGMARHASTHAAGVVISDKPMTEYVPLYQGKNQEIVTQWDMKRVEKVGLVKFDFLGLKTMTVIEDALEIIREQGREPPDLDTLPLTDKATYELFSRGDTDGIFQVESDGMRKYLRQLKPSCFEDIIAMLALYRPGPLGSGMVQEFIDRKHGLVEVSYPHQDLEPVLKPTYGVIVYQEQVMQIAQVLSGYSLGEGDLLRRAMGKKNADEMAAQRARFLKGTAEKGIPDAQAGEIFDLMEKFAEYGFNKSHSAAYALISYHTAYLKAHHAVAFMAALITSDIDNQDKVLKYISDCADQGIEVLPPDVNASMRHFSVKDGNIVYGLAGIKNVGAEAINEIVREREENGPYESMLDLASRVNLRKVTKRVLEFLIKAGAMDSFGAPRAALAAGLDKVAAQGQKRAEDRNSGQFSLMSLAPAPKTKSTGLGLNCEEAQVPEWDHEELMAKEKEALGFYLTSHPLKAYDRDLRRMGLKTLTDCRGYMPESEVKVAAIVTTTKEHITKKGDRMAFCGLEDIAGDGEAIFFPEAYAKCRELLAQDVPLLLTAKIGKDKDQDEQAPGQGKVKLIVQEARALAEAVAAGDEPVEVRVDAKTCPTLAGLKEIFHKYPGPAKVRLRLVFDDMECLAGLADELSIGPCPGFWQEIDGCLAPALKATA
ncbi:DNA polymerase III subunit alpha [Fundidesulfovibrio magnetotacticus]|uniref:DNA polymerase III subunit alpha n=1 Tax=Fundidesulfovibrio magnetotacticus TaxID=2730080 RepID=A0A6V8LTT0_9BACT|nr:DNA polymerase III subunit alpha [Fundidesulfovibrio magnetotacticus]GFK93047.1 DNA polymerase III subunit alpha [Fundidesulfovibrio magnetotacticus]